MRKKWLLIIALVSIVLLLFIYSTVTFFKGGGQRYPSDYIVFDPVFLEGEVVMLELNPNDIDGDSLADLSNHILNINANVIVIDNTVLDNLNYSSKLDTLLRSRTKIITIDNKDSNLYSKLNGSHNSYIDKEFYSVNQKLVTSFPVLSEDNIYHVAVSCIKQFHPRYEVLVKKLPDVVEIKYFGNYELFKIYRLDEFIESNKDLSGKIVLIGNPAEKKYYTPARYYIEELNSNPDMSSMILIANSILTLINYELINS